MAAKILLFTTVRWVSATRIAGGFAAVGCAVEALYPSGHILGLSRHVVASHRYKPLDAAASLAEAIARAKPDLVVPLDDRAAEQLVALSTDTRFDSLIDRSLGNPNAYTQLMSRSGFIVAARACDLRVPETTEVASESDVEAALETLGLPVVVKSGGSWGGDGVALARAPDEALEAVARLAAPPSPLRSVARAMRYRDTHFLLDAIHPTARSVSLQRFIPGMPATSSFACWRGKVLAALHFDVLETEGSTGPACVVRPVLCPEMDEAAQKIAAHFQLSGLHGLDFIRDDAGHVHLIESNPRASQTCYLALGPGRDLVAALVGALTGSPALDRPLVSTEETIALFPQEWTRDPASPHLESAYHDVPWDDPQVLSACLTSVELQPNAGLGGLFTTWKPSARRLPTP